MRRMQCVSTLPLFLDLLISPDFPRPCREQHAAATWAILVSVPRAAFVKDTHFSLGYKYITPSGMLTSDLLILPD
jgi:hypothetical protein